MNLTALSGLHVKPPTLLEVLIFIMIFVAGDNRHCGHWSSGCQATTGYDLDCTNPEFTPRCLAQKAAACYL
jgi:hypothetical protein